MAYITDDLRGSIYKLTYNSEKHTGNNEEPTNDKYISTLNNIKLNNINPGQQLTSPIIIEGDVPGNWYFEASFPIKLIDASGTEIAVGIAQAKGDWMTEDWVDFEALLNFTNPKIMNKRVLSQTIIDGVKLVLFFQNLFLNKFFFPLMLLFYGTSCLMYAGFQLFGRNFPELPSWKRVLKP